MSGNKIPKANEYSTGLSPAPFTARKAESRAWFLPNSDKRKKTGVKPQKPAKEPVSQEKSKEVQFNPA